MTDRHRLPSGLAPVTLRGLADVAAPAFVEATVLPGRGMMLLQARLRLASGQIAEALFAPGGAKAAAALDGAAEDFAGNRSFSLGGAILAPFANRIRGSPVPGRREIVTEIAGRSMRLAANWGGNAAGAERYAMHGLILDSLFDVQAQATDRVTARLAGDPFRGRWPGQLTFTVEWRLECGNLHLKVVATNEGSEDAPVGIGWHPYFRLLSGVRSEARLWLGAQTRARVNNADDVLPTGEVEPIAGGAYDFAVPGGRALGDMYLDDCFTDLIPGGVLAELRDPGSGLGLRLSTSTPAVRAIQVYAPRDEAFVVIEPQFNLANPYGAEWGGRDTGMWTLKPQDSIAYDVCVQPFRVDGELSP